MCGRLCCYCNHSSYSKRLEPLCGGKQPTWNDLSGFAPSSNLAPTRNIAVIYLDEHKNLILCPMVWGLQMISNGNARMLHNMRIETLLGPLQGNGLINTIHRIRKCAIVCDGFYEWNQKRPFFFYNGTKEYDTSVIKSKWKDDDWIEKGPPVMLLAGICSSSSLQGLEITGTRNSCAVITKVASSRTRHIHHRNPIMLDTNENIMDWLDCGSRNIEQSLQTLLSLENHLSCYRVKDNVNNSRYQEHDCHLPLSCFSTNGTLNLWVSKSQMKDNSYQDRTSMNADVPSLIKRKNSASDPASKKKSLITDWFKKTPSDM